MLTSKTLKVVGLALSVVGAGVGLAGSFVSDKRQSLEMTEQINEAVEQKFLEMSLPEPEAEEEL